MTEKIKFNIQKNIKGRVQYNEPMKRHTSFRIGGPADIWVEPLDVDDLKRCIQISKDNNIPIFILGNGTNLLVRDEGVRGIVINMLTPALKNIYWGNRKVSVTSSITLREFLNFCSKKGLSGLEFLAGVPGSIGGAVLTNAGARHYDEIERWHSIGDFIEEIRVMNYDGEINVLGGRQLSFGHKSLNIKDCIILEARFVLNRTTAKDVINVTRRYLKRKKETQDLNTPSAGCIFKNPVGVEKSAGKLIDECNLKGARMGGAAISGRHANFIVNTGNASSRDVISLVEMVKQKVKDRFGIELSLEIKIV